MNPSTARAWLAATLLATAIAAAQAPAMLSAEGAYLRKPPGVDVAAVYLTLRNAGLQPVIVIGVSSPLAGHAMLHETSTVAGQSRMRSLEKLLIAPGQSVSFAPGGIHVMLSGLKAGLSVGQTVPLVLLLASGERVPVTAVVRPLTTE